MDKKQRLQMSNRHSDLVENIDEKMAELGLRSDKAFAALVGVDQKTIWRIRNFEQSPTLELLEKIASAFGGDAGAWIHRR
jgi:transcriptional regulator with XRE-family HTH domain